MLNTERNTPTMGKRILTAARRYFHQRLGLQADFEHGQWWITNNRTGAQYSVIDAEGGQSVNGFDFEEVTPPEM